MFGAFYVYHVVLDPELGWLCRDGKRGDSKLKITSSLKKKKRAMHCIVS
jgi:hypothetical protein